MKECYNFKLEPGKKLQKINYELKEPVISVIIPFYNDKEYIEQSVNAVLNQTFPNYEILIIDDGSKDVESLQKLEEVSKKDKRIKIFHKENEGLSATRDYGAKKADSRTKYLMFADADDLMEKTFLECAYWALETNQEAAWVYSDSVGFGEQEYTWNKWFNSEKMKEVNDLVSMAMIRKEAFEAVNGYELREKAVNEDWNLWLKLIAKGYYPVHISAYLEWYRRKATGELSQANLNKERAREIIKQTASTITKKVEAIQYPKKDYNYDVIIDKIESIVTSRNLENGEKINILMIFPWLISGGADKFNLELVSRLDKEKYNVIIITTEPNKNVLRQQIEQYSTVYDLTSFIDKKYWISFINYIIEKENINLIFNSNSKFGYNIIPYLKATNPKIPIIDYIHMEEWYHRNGGYSRYSGMLNSVIDKTLTCNENSAQILCNYFKKDKEQVKTVYIGVDENIFNPNNFNKDQLLKRYNISEQCKYVISYICRITEQKRPMLLLEIIKELKTRRNDFQVLVVGDGNLLNEMKQKAKKMKIQENIMFLGNIENTEEIYEISDLTINCSIKEGIALTSYESLAMKVPVISSDVGGQKELINEHVGIIVPCMQKENNKEMHNSNYSQEEINEYVEAIEKVINNIETYKSKCRETIVDKFTIKNMINNMSAIFEEVHNTPNPEKIQNGEKLKDNIDITKELITINAMNDNIEYAWECREYEKKVYGREYSSEGFNYKYELLKEKLWKIPLWRKIMSK